MPADSAKRTWFGHVSRGLVGIAVSAAFVVLVLRGVDLAEVRYHFSQIDVVPFLPALVSLAALFVLRAYRWQYQMSNITHISFGLSLRSIVIGFMGNNVLPLRGGDLLRAHYLSREAKVGTTTAFTAIAVEHFLDAAALVTVGLVALLVTPVPGWMRTPVLILGTALLGVTAGVLLWRRSPALLEKLYERAVSWLPGKWLPGKLLKIFAFLVERIRPGLDTAKGSRRVVNQYLLALGAWVINGVLVYFTLLALDIQLSIPAIIGASIAQDIAAVVPAAPAQVGVFEYAVTVTLEYYKLDKSIALTAAVLLHAMFVIPTSLAGLVLLMQQWMAPKVSPERHEAQS